MLVFHNNVIIFPFPILLNSHKNAFNECVISNVPRLMCTDNDDKHRDSQPAIESGAKPQYSNVCSVNHCPPNVYVSTQWEGDDLDSEECPEMCKLLGSSEVVDRQQEAARQSDIVMDKTKDGRKKSDKILVHENLTYV